MNYILPHSFNSQKYIRLIHSAHSTDAFKSKVLFGDWVVLRAARDLYPGEECVHHYCDLRMPLAMRQEELSEVYG